MNHGKHHDVLPTRPDERTLQIIYWHAMVDNLFLTSFLDLHLDPGIVINNANLGIPPVSLNDNAWYSQMRTNAVVQAQSQNIFQFFQWPHPPAQPPAQLVPWPPPAPWYNLAAPIDDDRGESSE